MSRPILLAVVLTVLAAGSAAAQVVTGSTGAINGIVTDNTKDAKQVHVLTLALKAAKPGDLNWKLRVQTDLPEDKE